MKEILIDIQTKNQQIKNWEISCNANLQEFLSFLGSVLASICDFVRVLCECVCVCVCVTAQFLVKKIATVSVFK